MSHVLRVCGLLLLVAIPSLASAQDERQAATQALIAYFGAFVDSVKTGDPTEVSQHLTEPFVSIEPSRTSVYATRADYEAWLKPVLATVKERGYDHADWLQLDLKLLSKELAIASTLLVRYKSDNTEFGRAGATYLMRKVEDRWKIVSLTTHDTATVLKLD
jgi:ketosteroid isomerase-like protein